MRLTVTTILLIIISSPAFSQASDFITVKKRNNVTLASYFPGSPISFRTVYQNYINGMVQAVRNDSVFIREYNVQAVPNAWGVASIDTLGSSVIGLPYKDIEVVMMRKREHFTFIKDGTMLIVGGIGYAALNLFNGKYLKESITGAKNRKSLAIALGIAGTGVLLKGLHQYNNSIRKRYRIIYVHMQGPARLRGF